MRHPPLLVSAFAFAASASAQSFARVAESPFLALPLLQRFVAADFDGDGDRDVVGHQLLGQLAFHRNQGEGRFVTEATTYAVITSATQRVTNLDAADLDGDGDLDVLVGLGQTSPCGLPDRWLRNDGSGLFTLQTVAAVQDNTRQLLPFDFDNDGDSDLLQVNFHGGLFCSPRSTRVFENLGAGTFADVTSIRMPGAPFLRSGAAILDVQPDGWLDVAFDDGSLFLNNGTQLVASTIVLPALASVSSADVDGDLDVDLYGFAAGGLRIARNDGGGVFTVWNGPTIAGLTGLLAAGDIDGDGDLDMLLTSSGALTLLRQDPVLAFVDVTATQLPVLASAVPTAGFFDSDDDGDQDLLVADFGILHNIGGGSFVRWDAPTATGPGRLLDVDADGNLDLVGRLDQGPNVSLGYWRNLANGRFRFAATLATGSIGYEPGLVLFDADADGDQDLFVSRDREILLRNDGGAIFTDRTAAALPPPGAPPAFRTVRRAVAADFDGDGDIDLFLARGPQTPASPQDSLYRNDGAGVFTDVGPTHFVDTGDTTDAAGLDFDRDGDLDLCVLDSTTGVRLFANDGSGLFTDVTAGLMPVVSFPAELLVVDVDGDQDPDVVVGRGANAAVLLRNSNGVFAISPGLAPHQYSTSPVAVDFDVDGDADLLLDGLWQRNDGTGTFTAIVQPQLAASSPQDQHRFADADGDGDPDLVWSLVNQHRQLQNAVPPRLGLHGELRLHAQSNSPGWSSLGMLFLGALAPAPLPLGSLGAFRLDPGTALLHSASTIPAGGPAVVRYLCPNQPALLGSVLWAQALFLQSADPASWRLGNTAALRVQW
ncbi:MAG: VCBS repeat-containing protein [Planctomycetes bacterium]|nr:VCBS repeat-containing protein [Planctomycetota bacterium]